jgi:RNA polymerase sigma factor (sigma-70 family)
MFSHQAADFLDSIAPHMLRLVAYARHLTGRQGAAAEELLHDAILTCHARIERRGFQGEAEAYVGYLFVQIGYEYKEQYRQRRQLATESLELTPGLDVEDEGTPALVDVENLAVAVKTFVHAHYPPAWEQVFELHCEGLSYSEITFATGVVKSTAQQQVQKIKADVRREFGAAFEG